MISRLILAASVLFFLFSLAPIKTSSQANNKSARKFDEFGDILMTDIKARADNFAVQLQNEPTAKGFIVVYRSRRDLPGISYRYANRMRDYILNTSGVADERLVALDGGEADCLRQELWIVPPGTTITPRADAYQRHFEETNYAQKFDEVFWGGEDYPTGIWEGDLEAYAARLRAQPRAIAHVIVYAQFDVERQSYEEDGKQKSSVQLYRDPPGTARKVLRQAQRLLTRRFHLSPNRIQLVDGGYRRSGAVELWIVPRGEHAPIPTPNSFPRIRTLKKT
jgi:hypothetical protein